MRVVRSLADLDTEIERAAAEAESAFGDATVFVEPYVESSRHVEVQVVGDTFGSVLVLGERDCSIQRRHQKVLEEAPAPDIDGSVVEAMHSAARKAAEAIGYVGAGTVEFLYDPEAERFFFLEMNTRLQVEHPVTEAVTGLDLVELQVAVAEGRALDVIRPRAPRPRDRGPALRRGPRPRLAAAERVADQLRRAVDDRVRLPVGVRRPRRLGVRDGQRGRRRTTTRCSPRSSRGRRRGGRPRACSPTALSKARLHGLVTNRDLLVNVLRDDRFLDARVSTDFFERTAVVEASAPMAPDPHLLFAAAIALAEDARVARQVQAGVEVGWRNVVSQPHRTVLATADGEEHTVGVARRPQRLRRRRTRPCRCSPRHRRRSCSRSTG